ncbi:MAG: acyl-CoA reductase [Flavobacteriales bacterium]|nr:acyl-CoA reductase [Flavobacteriales bacterium]
MSLEKRIKAFVQLGLFLNQFKTEIKEESFQKINDKFYDEFEYLILRQKAYNGWFDKKEVMTSVTGIGTSLSEKNLKEWLSNYLINDNSDKSVGVIMAGNIPLVGFHDFLSVLITGNKIQAKLASNDNTLIRKIGEILIFIDIDFEDKIAFVEKIENFDAVIATGSDNTARYFDQYFGKYPNIIRKNRNSVAIINAKDGHKELNILGRDIFQYFGLGCRSVSKLYFPKGYKINTFFEAILDDYQNVTQNNKYANNYDYNKAVYLMGNNQLLDNGFLLLKEDQSLNSPVGVLNYEYYNSVKELEKQLEQQKETLQCIVSSKNTPIDTFEFGDAQCPTLSDYADNVDTIDFLLDL